jgi:DNA-binding NarL/FixJ family response regulator
LPGDATAPSGHLAPYSGISVIGEAGTGDDDVTEARRLRPAVAIIDFQLPTMSGIEATKLIKLESPSTAVIGLTAGVPDDTEKAMLNVGAVAVLDKAGLLQTLHPTIVEAVKRAKLLPRLIPANSPGVEPVNIDRCNRPYGIGHCECWLSG